MHEKIKYINQKVSNKKTKIAEICFNFHVGTIYAMIDNRF